MTNDTIISANITAFSSGTTSVNTLSIPVPAGLTTTKDAYLIILSNLSSSNTVTFVDSFSLLPNSSVDNGTNKQIVALKAYDGTEGTNFTINLSSYTTVRAICIPITNYVNVFYEQSTPYSAGSYVSSGTTVNLNGPSVNTGGVNRLVLWIANILSASASADITSPTVPTGFTQEIVYDPETKGSGFIVGSYLDPNNETAAFNGSLVSGGASYNTYISSIVFTGDSPNSYTYAGSGGSTISGSAAYSYGTAYQVTIGTPAADLSSRLVSTPDLTSGDIIRWSNVIGGTLSDVTVNSDGTYTAASGVLSFDWEVFDGTSWGPISTQYLVEPVDAIPDYFYLGGDSLNQDPGTAVVRNFTVSGIAAGISITFTATGSAQVSNDNASWSSSTNVQLGEVVYVKVIAGTYDATVTGGASSGGVSSSFTVKTRSILTPTITAQPTDQSVNLGHAVTFTAGFSNASTYQWYKDSVAISGATSNSLIFTPVTADNSTSYYCIATSSEGGSVTTDAVILTVLPAILRITSLPLQDFNTGLTRANLANLTVRVKNYNSTVTLLSTTVTTDASGIFIIESDQLGVQNDTVNVEIVETDGSYTAIPYVLSTAV